MTENLPFDTAKPGLSRGALICGIFAVLLFWNPLGLILAYLAAILGGYANFRRVGSKGMAVAGIVLGIVSVVLFFVASAVVHALFIAFIKYAIFTFIFDFVGALLTHLPAILA
ncbi:MAG TPA: hypothetical protein O0X97_04810 [Methanocorpusculum sp.]|nr:hypothetical protein [Methanocorpusculum sp.]